MNDNQLILYAIFAITSVLYCSIILFSIVKKLWHNYVCVQYFVYLLFYFFYVVPIISQLWYPKYEYEVFWRATPAMRELFPNLVYLAFVVVFSFFLRKSMKVNSTMVELDFHAKKRIINVCSFIVVGVLIFTIVNTGPIVILGGYGYAWLNSDIIELNEWVIGCGIISYLIVLGYKKYVSSLRIVFLSFIVFLFFWIVGKRYIVAETLIMAISILGMTNSIKGKKMLKYLGFAGIFVLVAGFAYGALFKENVSRFLDYFNVDFSRQYTLVYQFYCTQIDRKISITSFDSIVYLATFFVPRSLWPEKPYPFVNYLTLSLVGQDDIEFTNAGWATTCSIFSDLYDSLSFIGIFLGIYFFVILFKKINNARLAGYRILLLYFAVKLLTVQISSAIIQMSVMTVVLFILSPKRSIRILKS